MYDKKDILYPIFLDCCKYCPDMYWVNIFEELSYGKTPYGVFISKNFMCCNYKNKEFSYKIEQKEPEKLFNDIYNLLSTKLGLLSYQQKIKKRLDFNNMEDTIKESRQNWYNIKKKNIKELLIEKYVIDMKNKYMLSVKQCKYLLSLIYISLIFKVIVPNDIVYNNCKIDKIEGIDFKKNKIILKKQLYDTESEFRPQVIIENKSMSENWDKYLKELRKLL
jgi:hypothetical protein